MRIKYQGWRWVVRRSWAICFLLCVSSDVSAVFSGMTYPACHQYAGSQFTYGLWVADTGPWVNCTLNPSGPMPKGAAMSNQLYNGGIPEPTGFVPSGVTQITPVLYICTGAAGPGGILCPIGETGRLAGATATVSCTAGERWVDCVGRTSGTVLAPFASGERSACMMFRDQLGKLWSRSASSAWGLCGIATSPPTSADYCKVTSTNNWDIDFGSVERSDIPTTVGTEKTKDLTLTCTGAKTHDFSVKLNMTPTSWSTSQLATSNPDLGVQVTVGGTAAKLGDSFAMKVTGSGSTTLGFSVLRNPKTKALDIATGDFSASGTLVVSEL
ncbi:MAG TPA: hypothetical protein DGZ94_10830 [Serratia sp.]|nr:hypothetical protein [Serratia sp. (in: enterobacteria)]